MGPVVYAAQTSAFFADGPLAKDAKPVKFEPPKTGISLSMPVTTDRPNGLVAFTGARIVTMADKSGGIIDNGVVLVEE